MSTQAESHTPEASGTLAESALVIGLVSLAAILVLFVLGDGVHSVVGELAGSLPPPAR
jgi:hypothetical protein